MRRRLGDAGVETIGAIEPGSDGRRTLFLHPRTMGGVLVELVEERPLVSGTPVRWPASAWST